MPDLPPPAAPAERNKQIVAAKNLFFGTSYFLILSLPDGWGIVRSYLEPDVQSTVGWKGMVWVEAGQTDQIVFHRSRRIAVDFMVQIRLGKGDALDVKGMQVSSRGPAVAGGHSASFALGEVKQGFIKKKTYKALRVCFYCPELQHTLFLNFTGKCEESDLLEILASLPSLECH